MAKGLMVIEELCNVGSLNRSGGRAAVGYVMGSKRLKAIAVRGSGGVQVAEPDKFEFFA